MEQSLPRHGDGAEKREHEEHFPDAVREAARVQEWARHGVAPCVVGAALGTSPTSELVRPCVRTSTRTHFIPGGDCAMSRGMTFTFAAGSLARCICGGRFV